MTKLRLPRKLKKIITKNAIENCKLSNDKFRSLRLVSVNMTNRSCEIQIKIN